MAQITINSKIVQVALIYELGLFIFINKSKILTRIFIRIFNHNYKCYYSMYISNSHHHVTTSSIISLTTSVVPSCNFYFEIINFHQKISKIFSFFSNLYDYSYSLNKI